jgi:probable rRNA maturation factor
MSGNASDWAKFRASGIGANRRAVKRSKVSTSPPRKRAASSRTPPVESRISLTLERGPHQNIRRADVLRRIRAMVEVLGLGDVEVSFLLTDDARIHELNKVYRKKDRPTDVLAFAMQEGEFSELSGGVLGDVIVSVPTAQRQADERGVSLLEEVTMLLAHGLLHLLGWDHRTAAEDRRMRAETERLCEAARQMRRVRA